MTGVPVIPVTGPMSPHGSVLATTGGPRFLCQRMLSRRPVQGVDGVVLRRDEHVAPEDERLPVDVSVKGRRGPPSRHRGEVGDRQVAGARVVGMIGRPVLRARATRGRALGARREAGAHRDRGRRPARARRPLLQLRPHDVDRPGDHQQDRTTTAAATLRFIRLGGETARLILWQSRERIKGGLPVASCSGQPEGRADDPGCHRQVQGEGATTPEKAMTAQELGAASKVREAMKRRWGRRGSSWM